MANDNIDLRLLQAQFERLKSEGGPKEPPGGGGLEKRVGKLETSMQDIREKLIKIEAKVESIDRHGATKADMSGMESTLIKWFVATAFALSAMTFGIVRFLSH